MASQVQICNAALTKLGAARITDLLEDSRNARTMAAIYDDKRDAELAAHPWSFAITRASLPALSAAPAFGWARAFPLPADCLKLVEVGEQFMMYADLVPTFQIEGRSILTDEGSPLRIRYLYRVTNPGLHSPLFNEALACRLAAEAAETITQNSTKRDQAWAEHKRAIVEARRANAIEQPPQGTPETSWTRAMVGI